MKKQQIKAGISAAVIGVLSPLAMVVPASAANQHWAGHHPVGSYDGLAGTASNWQEGIVPASGDSVHFGTDGINQIIDFDYYHTASSGQPGAAPNSLELLNIVFDGERTGSSSKSYTVSSDTLINLSGDIRSIMTGTGGDQALKASVALAADSTFKTTDSNTLTVGDTATTLDLGAKTLTLLASGGTITLQGKITGTGNIVKAGTGKVNIMTTPSTAGYTGSISLPTGEIIATGTLGAVSRSGGTLKGTGTVGAVSMSSGSIAPGNSPGTLNTGTVTLTGGTHAVELGGKAAGEFDKLNVVGDVDLGSATDLSISLVNSFTPAVNDSFVIIDNDGTDAVKGSFKGLKDGEKVTLSSYTYQINYDGGTGNDVVLLVTGTPSAPDTGVGSLIGSPVGSLLAALLVAGSVVGYRYFEIKKARR